MGGFDGCTVMSFRLVPCDAESFLLCKATRYSSGQRTAVVNTWLFGPWTNSNALLEKIKIKKIFTTELLLQNFSMRLAHEHY